MAEVDLDKAVGWEDADIPVSWNKRDLLLYSLGIGAKLDDYALVNELHESWTPFPTYPVVLSLKGADQDVNDFKQRISSRSGGSRGSNGLPKFDPNRVVHGTQSVQVLKPLPPVSGEGWKLTRKIVGVVENKSGIILTTENLLVNSSGEVFTKLYSSSFHLRATATGKPYSKHIAGPPPPSVGTIPTREPDYVVEDQTTPEQAVLYRLSGDYNALHIDPKIGQAGGFGGVILHGLSTFGFAARAVVTALNPTDPNALTYFGVRFTSPVKPGDKLQTSIWEVGPAVKGEEVEGLTEVVFTTRDVNSGKVCLGNGVAWIKKAQGSKEKGKL